MILKNQQMVGTRRPAHIQKSKKLERKVNKKINVYRFNKVCLNLVCHFGGKKSSLSTHKWSGISARVYDLRSWGNTQAWLTDTQTTECKSLLTSAGEPCVRRARREVGGEGGSGDRGDRKQGGRQWGRGGSMGWADERGGGRGAGRGQKGSARQAPTLTPSPHTPTRLCAELRKDAVT